MANVNAAVAPAGNGVASFKVPRPWESNVPKFTTEDKDDLRDFIEQVDDIITLAQVTDDDEKKRLLTSYLPAKTRGAWRELAEYAAGTSYADFKKAVLKVYPEVQEDLDGTLEELERLCAENRNIRRAEEGKLKRFGMRFRALVKKLSQAPAIILNKEACRRYLDALERGFAESLRMAINTRNLIKEDLRQAGVGQQAAGQAAVDHRKEDPILLDELIKMAEQLANTGGTEATWGDTDAPELKRSDRFPMVKIERRETQFEELGGEVSSLRDALAVVQKQSQAAHEELMKAFQNMKNSPPAREDNESRESMPRGGMPNTYGSDRQFGRGYGQGGGMQRNQCYYCDGHDHYSRECTVKAAHIHKGWVVVEDGQQRLADGNYIPKGRGSPAARVEEYWQKKGAAGQHMYSDTFYGGAPEDEFDTLRDEVRTLRVKLNQVTAEGQRTLPTQQLYMINTPAQLVSSVQGQPYMNQAVPTPTINMEELGRTEWSTDHGVHKPARAGFLKASRMEARVGSNTSRPPEGNKLRNQIGEKGNGGQDQERPSTRQELPYRFVKPLGAGARTLPALEGNADRVLEDSGKAYKLKAPIQRDGLTDEMLEHINSTEVTVRLGDLFGMSKDLREGERLRLTRVRQPLNNESKGPELVLPTNVMNVEQRDASAVEQCNQLNSDALELGDLPEVEGVFVTTVAVDGIPAGSVIAQDPYLQYLEGLEEGEEMAIVVGFDENQELKIEQVYRPRGGVMVKEKIIEAYVAVSEDADDLKRDTTAAMLFQSFRKQSVKMWAEFPHKVFANTLCEPVPRW
ncbi:hypothetical protein B0H13DRAFT_1891107 [Mycena leptocephala]|nr:hypothetical protein B0H13DRAFT_1891107 [Mycena leptocephala]